LTAARDSKESEDPPPIAYQIYVWRKKMKVGWFEAMQTPISIIKQDLEMMSFENKYLQKPTEQPKMKGNN
jgi:hypothetical protein